MQKIIAEIDTEKLRYNAKLFKERSGAKLCAVVKANAYGHGDIGCVSALSKVADYFAVALVEEALSIKLAAAGKEIWVLTPPTDCETVLIAAQNGFTLCVADYPSAKRIVSVAERYGVGVKVHIKLNTGMNRYGLGSKNLFKVCRYLAAHPFVHVSGMYSHLYAHTQVGAQAQRGVFDRLRAVCLSYFPNAISHLAATYGAAQGKEFSYDAVRIGLGLYGYLPEGEYVEKPELQKVMKAYAECVTTRRYSFGGVGYGEAVGKPKRLSVVRIGYADGCGHENTKGYKGLQGLANSFCMDACIVEKRLRQGKKVLVFDDAEEVARARGTISYEVLCLTGMRAEWIYL